ncbi:MAG: hypothetical protein WD022_08515, partial [Balneolaceae bacterium]
LPNMCEQFQTPSLTQLDHNAYVKLNKNDAPVIWMAQKLNSECINAFKGSNELHQANSDYASNSVSLINYEGPLFKSMDLKNFELLKDFEAKKINSANVGAFSNSRK